MIGTDFEKMKINYLAGSLKKIPNSLCECLLVQKIKHVEKKLV